MFMSLDPSIDVKYLSLNSLTINKKCNLWTDSLITIVYIMSVCIVSIEAMFDDRLHMHFTGNYSQLGHVVVVSGDIRFDGIMP
jgi:hypothetical protein